MNEEPVKKEPPRRDCMQRWSHRWQWIWEGPLWTDRSRCTTCGAEKDKDGKIYKDGAPGEVLENPS